MQSIQRSARRADVSSESPNGTFRRFKPSPKGGLPRGYARISAAGIAAMITATAVVCCVAVAVTAYAEQENEDDDPAAVVTTKIEA